MFYEDDFVKIILKLDTLPAAIFTGKSPRFSVFIKLNLSRLSLFFCPTNWRILSGLKALPGVYIHGRMGITVDPVL